MTERRQRILFLVSSLGGGGAERVATLLCNHWVGQGHDVTLMATYSGRGGCDYYVDPRIAVRYLADETGAKKTGPLGQARRLLALRRAIVNLKPDRVISFLTNVNVAALIAALGTRAPVIASERIFPTHRHLSPALELARRLTYPLASAVVMQTRDGAEWLARACPGARGAVVTNPIVTPILSSGPTILPASVVDPNRRVLLGAGRLVDQKGFGLLITAFSRIHREFSQWDLVILGDGPNRCRLNAQIQDVGLAARVHMPGRAGNMSDWYERANAFALTSRYEGFPNALLEALAHGLPAVSFDIKTGPRDLITPGVNGWLVDPAEGAEGLEAALRQLLSGQWRPSSAATDALRSRFALDAIAQQWLDIPV